MTPPCRYVVLHHTGVDPPHFDLLFEIESNATALTALRCPRWPARVGDALKELPEHRLLYLDYEGPISGGRGEVARVDQGKVHVADLAIEPPTLGLRLVSATHQTTTDLTLTHGFDPSDHSARWTAQTMAFMHSEI